MYCSRAEGQQEKKTCPLVLLLLFVCARPPCQERDERCIKFIGESEKIHPSFVDLAKRKGFFPTYGRHIRFLPVGTEHQNKTLQMKTAAKSLAV